MGAAGADPKHGAVAVRPACPGRAPEKGRPVEIPIAALHQPGIWLGTIVGGAGKGVKGRVAAAKTDPKHGAAPAVAIGAGPALDGCSVEIAVAALHQPGLWIASVVGRADKGVQSRVGAAGADPKHGAVAVRPAEKGRSVEIAVAALHQPGIWLGTIVDGTAKRVNSRLRLCIGMERSTSQNHQDNDQ